MNKIYLFSILQGYNLKADTQLLFSTIIEKVINNKLDPKSIETLNFQGLIAGSEFLTFKNNVIYIATDLHIAVSSASNVVGANSDGITLFDETNTASYFLTNSSPQFNVTQFFLNNEIFNHDLYFSRITQQNTVYQFIKFNGFRLTY